MNKPERGLLQLRLHEIKSESSMESSSAGVSKIKREETSLAGSAEKE